jgi:energy-coupling factor transporter ATP-binding protein EcfA2
MAATDSTPDLLQLRHLGFAYPEYPGLPLRPIFGDVGFALPEGQITVLLGRPDSGKTTLCRILMGLVPRFSGGKLSGQLLLAGAPLSERPPYELLEQVGLVFQNPGEQLVLSRCDSEVAFALESLGVPRAEMQRRVAAALGEMGLAGFEGRDPQTLSGGEKKKLSLACLAALDPDLWLLDETLEELDPPSQRRLLRGLQDRGKTVLLLSAKWHELFLSCVGRVLHLVEGRVQPAPAAPGTPEFSRWLEAEGYSLGGGPPTAGRAAAQEARLPVLSADGVRFHYEGAEAGQGRPFTLQIDSLELHAGEVTALVGENGSGKSTLARLLCGLLSPRAGSIRVRGGSGLEAAPPERLNSFTAYLFQDPDLQIFLPTVYEELAYGLKLRGLEGGEIGGLVSRALQLFELPQAEVPPALMSYGARKRLQAAVYYLLERPLAILDEADSGLGVREFARLIELFRGERRALLFITHDQRLAEAFGSRILRMRAGRLS